FNCLSLLVGYFVPQLFKVERRQAVSIGMEVGVHNGMLAVTIASSPLLLNSVAMAMPAAIYSIISFFTAAGFSWFISRSQQPQPTGGGAATARDESSEADPVAE